MTTTAIILAGGTGSRVGACIPKQFIEAEGRSVVGWSILAFERTSVIDRIGIVCHADHLDRMREIVKKECFQKVCWIISGGHDFQHSVLNSLEKLQEENIPTNDIVLYHYAASPFITEEIIVDAVNVATKRGECVSAANIPYLLGSNDGEFSNQFIDRDKVLALNTPHAFRFDRLFSLYQESIEKGLLETVEPHPSSLQFALGRRVWLSKGSVRRHLKIVQIRRYMLVQEAFRSSTFFNLF